MRFRTLFSAVTALALSLGAASAATATVTNQYKASSAIGSGADHSLWISTGLGGGIGKDFDFDPAGLMTFLADGTASLIGRVVSQSNAGAWFDLAFNFDSTFLQTPNFKSENGSTETTGTFFRDLESGSLTGGGILAGLDLSITRLPVNGYYAAQIGAGTPTQNGANNKNNNFGMAVWFKIGVESATCSICSGNGVIDNLDGKQGDVNIDLSPVPVPAAGLLLAGALGALGILRRRRNRPARGVSRLI